MTTKELTSLIIEDIIAEIPIQMDGDEQGIREEMSALIYSHVERYRQQFAEDACSRFKMKCKQSPCPNEWLCNSCKKFIEFKSLLNKNKE